MKRQLFNIIAIVGLSTNIALAQNNLTMKAYQNPIGSVKINYSVLDAIFGTVTSNGTVKTTDDNATTSNNLSTLPSTASGFGGVQLVIVDALYGNGGGSFHTSILTLQQADAIIDYVKSGGIFIGDLEGVRITDASGPYALKYIGEALFCGNVTLNIGPYGDNIASTVPAVHPNDGLLLLNTNGATSVNTSTSSSWFTNVPNESAVFYASPTSAGYTSGTACSDRKVLDVVIPSYPGVIGGRNNNCNVQGMALLSGELNGIMMSDSITPTQARGGSQSNKNYAQLIYDFLYSPTNMTNRINWATIPANTNTTCPPAVSCISPTGVVTSPANQSVPNNTSATITVTATGATSYQWYSNTSNSNSGGTLIPGATGASYSPANTTPGTYYYYVVANNNGCTATSTTGGSQIASQVTVTPCNAGSTGPVVN